MWEYAFAISLIILGILGIYFTITEYFGVKSLPPLPHVEIPKIEIDWWKVARDVLGYITIALFTLISVFGFTLLRYLICVEKTNDPKKCIESS